MEGLIVAMFTWIAGHSNLPVPETLPSVVFASYDQLEDVMHGPEGRDGECKHPKIAALYDPHVVTVYLCDDWDEADTLDQSRLLHELVHHAQHVAEVAVACPAQMERLAYTLQVEWLRDQGLDDPYEQLGINEMFIMVVSMCRPDL